MRDLGQWRLSALEREQASLGDDLQAVFTALESDDLAFGPQAALTVRRARALQKRLDAVKGESERVRRKARRTRFAPGSPKTPPRPPPRSIASTRSARSSPS